MNALDEDIWGMTNSAIALEDTAPADIDLCPWLLSKPSIFALAETSGLKRPVPVLHAFAAIHVAVLRRLRVPPKSEWSEFFDRRAHPLCAGITDT